MNNEPNENKEPVREMRENMPMDNVPDLNPGVDAVGPEARPLMREDLVALMQELLIRMNGMNGKNGKNGNQEEPPLNEDQTRIMDQAQSFGDSVAGPSRDQLSDSTKNPSTLEDMYDEIPDWAERLLAVEV
jgi:hypothetical protein